MATQTKYECGMEVLDYGRIARVCNSDGKVLHEGTCQQCERYLRDRSILPLYLGDTHAERLRRSER